MYHIHLLKNLAIMSEVFALIKLASTTLFANG